MLMMTAVAMPFLLLLLMLAMERVEEPLRVDELGHSVRGVLMTNELMADGDATDPDGDLPAEQVESLVREGYGPALERYWRRRRVLARLRREG